MPSEPLIGLIDCFYVMSCDITSNELLFNDGMPAMVCMSSPESMAMLSVNKKTIEIKGGWVSGGITKNTYIEHLFNTDYLFIIRFNPTSFYTLFEIDTRIFKQQCIGTINEILKTKGNQLALSVFGTTDISDKINTVEAYIGSLEYRHSSAPLLSEAINFIKAQKGRTSIKDVSHKIGANYKWLERKFSSCIGLTPKEYANLQRFAHTYLEMTEDIEKDFLSIAVQNGYYDQSHFFKDFRSYAGVSPLQYIKALNPVGMNR